MEFKIARLDKLATIISIFTTAFLVCLSIFFIYKAPYGWIISIGMMLIPIVSYLLSPKRYIFEGPTLVIKKVIGTRIVISLSEIEGCITIPNFSKLRLARTFGNGGLSGYYGLFSTAEYGNINCQLTNLKNVIIIKSKIGNFAVSPLEFTKFEEYLKTVAASITGEIGTIEPMQPEKLKYASALILLVPIAIFLITLIIILLNYAQLPERIAIHFDFQGNPDGWGSKNSYLVGNLVPAGVLLLITFIVFFIVRRTTSNRAIPYFLMIFMCWVQVFIAFISIDLYWVNIYHVHLIPTSYCVVGFLVVMALLLFFYYKKIVKRKA